MREGERVVRVGEWESPPSLEASADGTRRRNAGGVTMADGTRRRNAGGVTMADGRMITIPRFFGMAFSGGAFVAFLIFNG